MHVCTSHALKYHSDLNDQNLFHSTISASPGVSIWPCQRNLIKTFQNEAIPPLITKITLKFFWTFSFEVIRPRKITIWWRHFRNKSFFRMKLSKNWFYKSWASKLIFFSEIFFRKIWTRGSNNFDRKCSKFFLMLFLWSVES